jgi:hypothetical protein
MKELFPKYFFFFKIPPIVYIQTHQRTQIRVGDQASAKEFGRNPSQPLAAGSEHALRR